MRFFILKSVLLAVFILLATHVIADMSNNSLYNKLDYEFVEVDAYNDQPTEPCPTGCSNHGVCTQDGQCLCFDGWSGTHCAFKSCPAACLNHGSCEDGQCQCKPGWTGYDCSYRGCKNDCNGHGACHISPFLSECVCFPGYKGKECETVDEHVVNPVNIRSGCKDDCNHHGICSNGACYCNEGWGGKFCQQPTCVNNCSGRGFCDTKRGICTCLDTVKYSGASCEIQNCPNNCSNKGKCLPSGKCKCDKGYFGRDCAPENCESDCFFPNGECTLAPIPTLRNSSNIDFKMPERRGFCKCSPFFRGPTCAINRCPDDCSGHGTCDNYTHTCKCTGGWTGVACNFKPCTNGCINGACKEGKCICDPDFEGEDCTVRKSCPNHCNNSGTCRAGECYCQSGFFGPDCSLAVGTTVPSISLVAADGTIIPPGQKVCSPACDSKQGICVIQGANEPVCRCRGGFTGATCSTPTPATPAAATNSATPAVSKVSFLDRDSKTTITTRKEKEAPKLALSLCNPLCGLGGRCVALNGAAPQCICKRGYYGKTCEIVNQSLVIQPNNSTTHITQPITIVTPVQNNTLSLNNTSAKVSLVETGATIRGVPGYYDEETVWAREETKHQDDMLLRALDQIIGA